MDALAGLEKPLPDTLAQPSWGGSRCWQKDWAQSRRGAGSTAIWRRGGRCFGGSDGPDGRGARYLAWSWDPDPADTWTVTEYAFVLRHADGSVRTAHESHHTGLFSRDDWLRLLTGAGFRAESVQERTSEDRIPRVLFLGHRPTGTGAPARTAGSGPCRPSWARSSAPARARPGQWVRRQPHGASSRCTDGPVRCGRRDVCRRVPRPLLTVAQESHPASGAPAMATRHRHGRLRERADTRGYRPRGPGQVLPRLDSNQ